MKFINCKIIASIIMLTGLICSIGCAGEYDPDCGCNCTYNNLGFETPYKEGNKLKFADSLGNKLAFTLNNSIYKYFREGIWGHNPDCGLYTTYTQYNENFFEEELGRKKLFLGNYAYGASFNKYGGHLKIGIDSCNFIYFTRYNDLSDNESFIPQISINGKNYNNVAVTKDYTRPDTKIYYNSQIGIISFKIDSVQWYLDN